METTLVPFASLPRCALDCGHLYDANGACVPPAKPHGDLGTYASCFCADPRVSPFSTGTANVCDTACTAAGEQGGLGSIHNWFTSFCSANAKAVVTTSTSANGGSSGSTSGTPGAVDGSSGDWISTHWQWVIFIVVVVFGIAGIWIGACVWRRRYLRKRDRQYALGKSRGALPGQAGSGAVGPSGSHHSVHMPQAGFFAPASISTANVYETEKHPPKVKKERKKWVVTERT